MEYQKVPFIHRDDAIKEFRSNDPDRISKFESESDDEVLSWIIVMIATVSGKGLGFREDDDEPDVLHGDLEKAKWKF